MSTCASRKITEYTAHCTLYNVLCAVHIVQRTQYNVHSTLYSALSIFARNHITITSINVRRTKKRTENILVIQASR